MPTQEQEGIEQTDSTKEDSSFLPKLEDLAVLTGLFNPEHIVEEIQELDEQEKPPLRAAQSAEGEE